MKCIGLIGGIGWESTSRYYRLINEELRNRLGGVRTARIVLDSIEFSSLESLVSSGQWNEAGAVLADSARRLENAGADCVVLCSNQMHFVAGHITDAVKIPLLHVGAAIGEVIRGTRVDVGLLGTRFTMEHDFLIARQPVRAGRGQRRIHTPPAADCDRLDAIIYREICRGSVRAESGTELLRMANELYQRGAKFVILVSSELGLVINPRFAPDWLYDSTELHSAAAVQWALGETKSRRDFSHVALTAEPGARMVKRSKADATE